VLRDSLRFLRGAAETSVTLVVVGKKARDFYRRRPSPSSRRCSGSSTGSPIRIAQELANGLIEDYLAEEVDEVHLMYNEFRSVAVQRPVRHQLLPIEATGGTEGGEGPQEEYLYEPGPRRSWPPCSRAT